MNGLRADTVVSMFRIDHAISGVHASDACYLCHNPNNLVDTEVTIPYEGVIAICTNCARSVAMTAGWDLEHTAEQWETLTSNEAESNYIADSLLAANDAMVKAIREQTEKHKARVRTFKNRLAAKA